MSAPSPRFRFPSFLLFSVAFLVPGATPAPVFFESRESGALPPGVKTIIELRDFVDEEVKGAGFVLTADATVHIRALGGGDRVFWRDMFDDDERSQMYASGWIIDAGTRDVVWEMTLDNTSGRSYRRSFDGPVELRRGAYEVYFAAHGYYHGSAFSNSSVNIDRRRSEGRGWRGSFLGIFGGDSDDLYDEFMEYAKEYGIALSVDDQTIASVETFAVPAENKRVVFSATKLGDREYLRKQLTVARDLTVHLYALGEGRRRDEVYDYGWIVNSETRERIWEFGHRDVDHAGGASKNIKYDEDLFLPKGTYELYVVTDDSHSNDDWNAKPPYDPFSWGITITAKNDTEKDLIKIGEIPDRKQNVILSLTRIGDDDFASGGFSLKNAAKVRIYALGESDGDGELADYGWVVNARTRERVWSMEGRKTFHAGGDSKNRLADEVIELPRGDYLVYYQTDGSHAYDEWNADPPFDEESWGITVMGMGERFDPKIASPFSEEREEADVIAQLIRVRDDRHVVKSFTLEKRTRLRVYAIGEGVDREMVDYGWIEDAKNGDVVWEMTYDKTERAGGAKKNRMISETLTLEKGEYELHYRTDDSHSYSDWNDDPPEDRMHWGITVYEEKEIPRK